MLTAVFILAFVVCLGIAAGAMLLSHQLVSTYAAQFHRHYLYYLAAFYAFAIYGIWGQIATRGLLGALGATPELVAAVANVLPLLAVPFLFVSWVMLPTMACSLVGAPLRTAWIPVHAGLFLLLVVGAWLAVDSLRGAGPVIGGELLWLEAGVALALEAFYVAAFGVLALRSMSRHDSPNRRLLRRFVALFAGGFLLRAAALPAALVFPWVLGAVPLYFASNAVPLAYLWRNAERLFEPIKADKTNAERMQQLFEQHGITKRERQIVLEICSGKTNREIAETLFISLQTVKDHTHRIYSKLGIGSRVQLIKKMSE